MKIHKNFWVAIIGCCCLVHVNCKDQRNDPDPELASIGLLRGNLLLCGNGEFGEVQFLQSCREESRETFNLAISLLHSFEYAEAEKAFVKVIDQDPDCAMAYWGVAMSNFHSLWAPPTREELEKGSKVLEIANKLVMGPRETAYLKAIGMFYKDWEKVDHRTRTTNFSNEMGNVYERFKDDKEAAIFYALALLATADPADKTYEKQLRSGKILESIYPDQPDHPGIAHYIIHNYDYPELAILALPTARRYAQIAPASSHAQHMPSHIFTRLGLWQESISSNLRATESALCYSQSLDSTAHWDEEVHGMDYLVYAYLQVGDNKSALDQYAYLKTFKKVFPANFKIAYTAAAIPARIALENKDWKAAAALELPAQLPLDWDAFPWQKSIIHFARAIGSARSGDIGAAENEVAILESLHGSLLQREDSYSANQVQIQILGAKAWVQFAKGWLPEAISLMNTAMLMENSTAKHPVTPGEVLPAGELYADLLMMAGEAQQALAAYESDLKQHPNRFNGIYGAAMAAKSIGDMEKAGLYFRQLAEQGSKADGDRPELLIAKTFLQQHQS